MNRRLLDVLIDAKSMDSGLWTLVSGLALIAGTAVREFGSAIWFAALVVCGAPLVWRTFRGMFRGQFAADIVAALAIVTAVILLQPFAGLVIVLMQSGGELLERFAEGRASRAIRALEDAAPREAHRLAPTGETIDVPVRDVMVGDAILVRPGEMVPCDGTIASGTSHLDESRLTGEPLPRRINAGDRVQSGAINLDSAVNVSVTARAAESLYARIVELVRDAQAHKAPIQRLADRYAVWFTPLTLLTCAVAWWISGDPVRVLAVLVVATPCPLILAAPVAIVSGMSRAASRQIIMRTGDALERIASVDTAVFDKTGTLTIGRPDVSRVTAVAPWDEIGLLELVAAVERRSGHLLARTTVDEAARRGVSIVEASDVIESAGRGVAGIVRGHRVTIGAASYVTEQHPAIEAGVMRARDDASGLRAIVVIDGQLAGTIDYADRVRENLHPFFEHLARLGVRKTVLLSGDHERNVREVASMLGVSDARSDLLPGEKVTAIQQLVRSGHRVLMTGDGTNDAPALSASTVGVALGAHGGGVTAEAADIVLLTDDVTRVADAIEIGRWTMRITRQSVVAGLGLSGVAMIVAAGGYLAPAMGALIQELIDVAVILNALRAAGREGASRSAAVMRPQSPASPATEPAPASP